MSDINPKPRCFSGLASELTDIDSEVVWSNFDEVEDEETAYQFLAEDLLALNGPKFPLTEPYADTPMQNVHTMCITLLNVYYPITEIALWMDNPEYEPKLHSPLNTPQAKLSMAIAKAMLDKSGATTIYDSHIDDEHVRDWLHGNALGRTGHIGLHTIRSGRYGGKKGGVQSPEELRKKKEFVIRQFQEIKARNPNFSTRNIARLIEKIDKITWESAGISTPWKISSIRECIKQHLTNLNKLAK